MQFHTDYNIQYYKPFERQESVDLDSSRIVEFKRCPRAYFFRYILNLTGEPNFSWFMWGSGYHKFRELLELKYKELIPDQFKATPAEINEAGMVCLHHALSTLKTYWVNKIKSDGPIEYKSKKFEFQTLDNLLVACIQAFNYWQQEKALRRVEVLDVEQAFSIEIPNGVTIGGRFDQIIRMNDRIADRDFKTGTENPAWYSASLLPNHQFMLYTYALWKLSGSSTIPGVFVEYLGSEEKGKEPKKNVEHTLQPFPIQFQEEQLLRWENEVQVVTEAMKFCRESDIYPRNESKSNCKFCQFKDVCKAPSLNSENSLLRLKYKKKIWNHQDSE